MASVVPVVPPLLDASDPASHALAYESALAMLPRVMRFDVPGALEDGGCNRAGCRRTALIALARVAGAVQRRDRLGEPASDARVVEVEGGVAVPADERLARQDERIVAVRTRVH